MGLALGLKTTELFSLFWVLVIEAIYASLHGILSWEREAERKSPANGLGSPQPGDSPGLSSSDRQGNTLGSQSPSVGKEHQILENEGNGLAEQARVGE